MGISNRILFAVSVLVGVLGPASLAQGQSTHGPSHYFSFNDSPFKGIPFTWFYLEDVEDGQINTPGLSIANATPGGSLSVEGPGPLIDSVDGDDGKIDGCGAGGHSIFGCPSTFNIVFDASKLGGYPTHAGVVWTDGGGIVTVIAYDANNDPIATLHGNSADGSYWCSTDEDRFYGFSNPGGISRIYLTDQNGCMEFDHVQYGLSCPADYNGDGFPDIFDFVDFVTCFEGGACPAGRSADYNGDGFPDIFDFNDFIDAFEKGC